MQRTPKVREQVSTPDTLFCTTICEVANREKWNSIDEVRWLVGQVSMGSWCNYSTKDKAQTEDKQHKHRPSTENPFAQLVQLYNKQTSPCTCARQDRNPQRNSQEKYTQKYKQNTNTQKTWLNGHQQFFLYYHCSDFSRKLLSACLRAKDGLLIQVSFIRWLWKAFTIFLYLCDQWHDSTFLSCPVVLCGTGQKGRHRLV